VTNAFQEIYGRARLKRLLLAWISTDHHSPNRDGPAGVDEPVTAADLRARAVIASRELAKVLNIIVI